MASSGDKSVRDAGVTIGAVVLGKYRIDSVLGQGGMGVVAQAHHLALDERVAIKFLRSDVVADQEACQRFLREAQAAVKLKSEHVARVVDVGTLETGSPYMVMEFLEGVDLDEMIEASGVVAPPLAADFVIQACDAVGEAHSLGMVHRDLKPSNIFVTWRADGSPLVKVLDFGISKAPVNSDLSLTKTASVLGTPAYMSPEQMRSARKVDARSDVWSLGTVLYELVCGHRPFEAETFSEMCVKVAVDAPTPISVEVPADYGDVIYKCLEKDPAQRYQNVAELAAALAPFAHDGRQATLSVERIQRMLKRLRPSPTMDALPTSRMDAVSGPLAMATAGVAPAMATAASRPVGKAARVSSAAPVARPGSSSSPPPVARPGSSSSPPPVARPGSSSSPPPPVVDGETAVPIHDTERMPELDALETVARLQQGDSQPSARHTSAFAGAPTAPRPPSRQGPAPKPAATGVKPVAAAPLTGDSWPAPRETAWQGDPVARATPETPWPTPAPGGEPRSRRRGVIFAAAGATLAAVVAVVLIAGGGSDAADRARDPGAAGDPAATGTGAGAATGTGADVDPGARGAADSTGSAQAEPAPLPIVTGLDVGIADAGVADAGAAAATAAGATAKPDAKPHAGGTTRPRGHDTRPRDDRKRGGNAKVGGTTPPPITPGAGTGSSAGSGKDDDIWGTRK